MKRIIIFVLLSFFSMMSMAHDATMLNIMKSCLHQSSATKNTTYTVIDTSAVITDNSYSRFGEANYIEHENLTIGYGKYRNGMAFYNNKTPYPISEAKFVNLGTPVKNAPKTIDYFVSDWGEVKLNNESYICVSVPFEGIGESGTHQYIRQVFYFKITGKHLYYTIGDIRN